MNTPNEIILYQPDNAVEVEVRLKNENVWLTQAQIALLFDVKVPAVSKHLKNIYSCGELDADSTFSILENVGNDGRQTYQTKFYSLDAILSVGYRVNSHNATMFRRWATQILKEYALRGYAINQRFAQIDDTLFQHKQMLLEHQKQIDFIVRTELPPREGIFYSGQIFDAYKFVSDLIEAAKKEIFLIDSYIDTSVLTLLSKRKNSVKATVYTKKISEALQLDLQKHNAQYAEIFVVEKPNIHDRFLAVDSDLYHLGASLKDLGKKLFAFSKMEVKAAELLRNIP